MTQSIPMVGGTENTISVDFDGAVKTMIAAKKARVKQYYIIFKNSY